MKLSVLERFMGINLLPKETDISTLRIVREAKMVLGLSSEESELLKMDVDDSGMVRWDTAAEALMGEVDVPLSPAAIGLIASALAKLNADKKLTEQHFTLYEKFYTAENKPAIVDMMKRE